VTGGATEHREVTHISSEQEQEAETQHLEPSEILVYKQNISATMPAMHLIVLMTYHNVTEYFEKFCCDKGLQLEPVSLIELRLEPELELELD
jgi:hypothetical protein